MAEDGVKVSRPREPQATTAVSDLHQTDTGSLQKGGTVRIVSAKGDLTGQRELSWVAGGISKYQGADCSQTFRFSSNPKPTVKPNLLMCWRTSAEKSVVAVVVDANGKPSKEKAVSALEQRWQSMK